jgi:hypothetical protein
VGLPNLAKNKYLPFNDATENHFSQAQASQRTTNRKKKRKKSKKKEDEKGGGGGERPRRKKEKKGEKIGEKVGERKGGKRKPHKIKENKSWTWIFSHMVREEMYVCISA